MRRVLALLLLAGCGALVQGVAPVNPEDVCICTLQYDPVCGKDGKTYGNACEATCAKVEVASQGECPKEPEGTCCNPDEFCCGNSCIPIGAQTFAACGEPTCCSPIPGSSPTPPGPSPTPPGYCPCPAVVDPVCGNDGKDYENECRATCAGVKVKSKGKCAGGAGPAPSCPCSKILAPVCGVDGKTYSNNCLLECAEVKKASEGACRGASPKPPPADEDPSACCPKDKPQCSCGACRTREQASLIKCAAEANEKPCCPAPTPPSSPPAPTPEPAPSDCVCPEIYAPVCGEDGLTYDNDCTLKCAGVKKAKDGVCSGTSPIGTAPTPAPAAAPGSGTAPAGSDDCCPADKICACGACRAPEEAAVIICLPDTRPNPCCAPEPKPAAPAPKPAAPAPKPAAPAPKPAAPAPKPAAPAPKPAAPAPEPAATAPKPAAPAPKPAAPAPKPAATAPKPAAPAPKPAAPAPKPRRCCQGQRPVCCGSVCISKRAASRIKCPTFKKCCKRGLVHKGSSYQ